MKENLNQTDIDAMVRVNNARIGSLANEPSLEYLLTLSHEINQWQARIQEAIYAHTQYGTEEIPMEKEHNPEDRHPCECEDWYEHEDCTGCHHADTHYPGEGCPFEE